MMYEEQEIQRMKDEALRLHFMTMVKFDQLNQLKHEGKLIADEIKQYVQERDTLVLTLKDAGVFLEYVN